MAAPKRQYVCPAGLARSEPNSTTATPPCDQPLSGADLECHTAQRLSRDEWVILEHRRGASHRTHGTGLNDLRAVHRVRCTGEAAPEVVPSRQPRATHEERRAAQRRAVVERKRIDAQRRVRRKGQGRERVILPVERDPQQRGPRGAHVRWRDAHHRPCGRVQACGHRLLTKTTSQIGAHGSARRVHRAQHRRVVEKVGQPNVGVVLQVKSHVDRDQCTAVAVQVGDARVGHAERRAREGHLPTGGRLQTGQRETMEQLRGIVCNGQGA
eukprot:scaffold26940_cov117-Phaeocystis_antarctica.AAC.16